MASADRLNWRDARTACGNFGAELAVLDTDEENNLVGNLTHNDEGILGASACAGDPALTATVFPPETTPKHARSAHVSSMRAEGIAVA